MSEPDKQRENNCVGSSFASPGKLDRTKEIDFSGRMSVGKKLQGLDWRDQLVLPPTGSQRDLTAGLKEVLSKITPTC